MTKKKVIKYFKFNPREIFLNSKGEKQMIRTTRKGLLNRLFNKVDEEPYVFAHAMVTGLEASINGYQLLTMTEDRYDDIQDVYTDLLSVLNGSEEIQSTIIVSEDIKNILIEAVSKLPETYLFSVFQLIEGIEEMEGEED